MRKTLILLISVCTIFSYASAIKNPANSATGQNNEPAISGDELWQEVVENYTKSLQYWPTKGSHSTISLNGDDQVASEAIIEGEWLYKDEKECFLVPARITQKGQTKETPEFNNLDAAKVKKWKKNLHGHPTDFLKALDKNNQANIKVGTPSTEGEFSVYPVEVANDKGIKVNTKFYVDPAKKVIKKVVTFGSATLGDAGTNYTFTMHESGVSILQKAEIVIVLKFGDNKTTIKQNFIYSDFVNKSEVRK